MSCTSSELLCMTSAASLKVTPSRLILFREIRRPPADKRHSGILLEYSAKTPEPRHNPKLFEIKLNKTSDSLPARMRPSLSAGPFGTIEATKIPRSKWSTASSPTITIPAWIQMKHILTLKWHLQCFCWYGTQMAWFTKDLHTPKQKIQIRNVSTFRMIDLIY